MSSDLTQVLQGMLWSDTKKHLIKNHNNEFCSPEGANQAGIAPIHSH